MVWTYTTVCMIGTLLSDSENDCYVSMCPYVSPSPTQPQTAGGTRLRARGKRRSYVLGDGDPSLPASDVVYCTLVRIQRYTHAYYACMHRSSVRTLSHVTCASNRAFDIACGESAWYTLITSKAYQRSYSSPDLVLQPPVIYIYVGLSLSRCAMPDALRLAATADECGEEEFTPSC